MRKHVTIILLILFCIYLPVFAGEKWGRDGAWGRVDPRWGRGLEAWLLEDLPYIVDWWRIEEGVESDSSNTATDSGDVVFFWRGSINGIALAQGTNSQRPKYSTDQINGYPAIAFDGIDDYLQGAFGTNYARPQTIIIVFKPNGGAVNYQDDNSFGCTLRAGSVYYLRSAGSQGTWTSTDVIANDKIWQVLSIVWDGGSSVIRKNGAAGTVSSGLGGASLSGLTIGARHEGNDYFTKLWMTDIIVCHTHLSTGHLQKAERWLNEHRGGIY